MNPVLKKLEELPVELRAIVEDDEIIQIIDTICDDFDIPYGWRGELIRATVRVLSGLMKPNEFVPFISEEYSLDQEDALQIALRINEKIFSAVKPQLASLYKIEDKQIAHKLKVPKKPKIAPVIPENTFTQRTDQTPTPFTYTPTHSENLMPEVKPIEPITQIPQPMQPVITQSIQSSISSQTEPKVIIDSPLTNKLDSLRVDKYRENI